MPRCDAPPVLLWLRRDLRLADNPALTAACAHGAPVIPVFILDDQAQTLGAAATWRLGLSLADLARRLKARGSRLVLRRGDALKELQTLAAQTGARAVHWSRLYDPDAVSRDNAVKAALGAKGIQTEDHNSHLLFEPWTVQTKAGGFYKVYTPFWHAVENRDVCEPVPAPAPADLRAPETWPASEPLDTWRMGAGMQRGAAVCAAYQSVGEEAAQERLSRFLRYAIGAYHVARDTPAVDGTSGLSEHLTYGELSPRQCWHAAQRAWRKGDIGAEKWLKELVWREFAYHLMHHSPHILCKNWRREWDAFPWTNADDTPQVQAWKQGRTGVPFVDAAMREMYVTGKMHNRGRMIVASYLTKHLMTHWQVGLRWFADCLTDWDVASNAMGWQWAAGSGPDAAPYFRIFNPVTQLSKFDPDHAYPRRWIAEGQPRPGADALAYFKAIPLSWDVQPTDPYPAPVVDLAEGRQRALTAYQEREF